MVELVEQYPEILAILIILAGFAASHFVSIWSITIAGAIVRAFRRFSPGSGEFTDSARRLVSRIGYYSTLALFVLLAIRALGIEGLGNSLDDLIGYVPRLLVAAAFILGGYVLGLLVRGLIANVMGTDSGRLLPVTAQYIVVVIATMTGLEQIAIELTFLANLTVVLFAAIVGSLSLAFALGSKELVANMLMRRELDRYAIGEHLKVGEVEGQVVELTRTAIVLATEDGNVIIPASLVANSVVVHRGGD